MLRHFKNEKICLVHLSGIKDFEMTKKLSEEAGKKTADYRLLPYMHDIATALAASDLVVSRAGATAISEIALKELASILVPYPYASDDHQTVNARLFFEKGAAAVIPDRQLSGKTLFDEITGLMGDRKKLEKMSENAAQLAVSDAAGKIKGLLYETV
jgi:UDP-N-acetylglucosamine--N-acetylmuramyl-(pentapeptide) pyrophosphoryl-undecaprenol N-acetylglucosamine transferase